MTNRQPLRKTIERREMILEIVNNYEPATQSEIVRRLEDAGIYVQQPTVCADLRVLGIKKVEQDGVKAYRMSVLADHATCSTT